jgi:ATPase subunit of ABC transporter with duplicated ATPase domains
MCPHFTSAAGLKDGKTFTADEPGDLVADLLTPEAGQQQEQQEQQQQQQAAAAGTSAAATADPAAAGTQAAAAAGSAATTQAAEAGNSRKAKKQAKQQQQQQQQQKEANRQERGQKHLTFSAYDRQVLQKMPAFIREQVPFLTTAKGAIDTTLLQLLKLLAVSDVGCWAATGRA